MQLEKFFRQIAMLHLTRKSPFVTPSFYAQQEILHQIQRVETMI